MTRRDRIEAQLSKSFNIHKLDVQDVSSEHFGHGGYDASGSHFHVVIQADELHALTRVAKHRAIYGALGTDLMAEIHALSIETLD